MSPLHAARASVGLLWSLAISTVALVVEHPLALLALLVAVVAAGTGAGAGRALRTALAYGIPFACLIALVNALVVRDGMTVLLRGGELPWVGSLDVTLEALAHGAVLGLRALIVVLVWALHSAAVDADGLLRAFRRLSVRSGLTAALAVRMVPLLARDGRRMAEAQRCRPGARPSRLAIVRAVAAGALDRATDVAATLEVRGYGGAARPARMPRPLSRHDVAFAASGAASLLLAVLFAPPFDAYPRLSAPFDPGAALASLALAAVVLLPFAARRGVSAGAPHPHAWRPAA